MRRSVAGWCCSVQRGRRATMCEWCHTPVPRDVQHRERPGDPGSRARRRGEVHDRAAADHRGGRPRTRGRRPPPARSSRTWSSCSPPRASGSSTPTTRSTSRDDELRALYRDLALVRRWDVEATALQRQGELGIWASLLGQEAAQVGAGRALAAGRHGLPDLPRARRRLDPRRRPAATSSACSAASTTAAGTRPRTGFNLYTVVIGVAVPARHRLRHGRAARRRRERGAGLPRRRRHQPGRGQRGADLGGELLRPGRLLLPEQPVRDQRADRAPVPGAAVPARGRASASPACGSTATTSSPSSP